MQKCSKRSALRRIVEFAQQIRIYVRECLLPQLATEILELIRGVSIQSDRLGLALDLRQRPVGEGEHRGIESLIYIGVTQQLVDMRRLDRDRGLQLKAPFAGEDGHRDVAQHGRHK